MTAVRPESYQHKADGSVEIHQQIVIARDSQKSIVLGKGGARIKAIGEAARKELAELLGVKVHLFPACEGGGRLGRQPRNLRGNRADWVK
jgi:GTP-binding protein Era